MVINCLQAWHVLFLKRLATCSFLRADKRETAGWRFNRKRAVALGKAKATDLNIEIKDDALGWGKAAEAFLERTGKLYNLKNILMPAHIVKQEKRRRAHSWNCTKN